MKTAISLDEQIEKLKQRGLIIHDEEKAKEILLDIGYFRFGFYAFPFETTYPETGEKRKHEFKEGSRFEDIVSLYYFDQDLRHLLLKYIIRIEVNIRNFIIYTVSNKYKDNPTWFVEPKIISSSSIAKCKQIYKKEIRNNPIIDRHHEKHIDDEYAPAWKALEFITFGSLCSIYMSLIDEEIKTQIANKYSLDKIDMFQNYINTIKVLRNACAHGNCIYELNIYKAVQKGPLPYFDATYRHNICGALSVVLYILHNISQSRENDLKNALKQLIHNFQGKDKIKNLIDFDKNVLQK